MSCVGIKDREVCSLAKPPSMNSSLKMLDISNNKIGCEGAELLSQMLYALTIQSEGWICHKLASKTKESATANRQSSTKSYSQIHPLARAVQKFALHYNGYNET